MDLNILDFWSIPNSVTAQEYIALKDQLSELEALARAAWAAVMDAKKALAASEEIHYAAASHVKDAQANLREVEQRIRGKS